MSKKASIAEMKRALDPIAEPYQTRADKETVPDQKGKIRTENSDPFTSKPIESKIPRGQRGGFQKLTISMPGEMLFQLKTIGARRKAAGGKDCDTSALIRESLAEWIIKQN